MTVSANGWPVLQRSQLMVIPVGGGAAGEARLPVSADDRVWPILLAIARFVDEHVEDINTRHGAHGFDVPDDWGFASRKIRGAKEAISNHASGTAIDLNAVRHPMGVRGTWSRTQVQAVDRFLAGFGGVVRWGEHYRTRVDGMHFELNCGPNDPRLRAAVAYAKAWLSPSAAVPGPIRIGRTLKFRRGLPKMRGADVAAVQRALNLTPTGVYDQGTATAVDKAQGALGVSRDGVWGKLTTRAADAHRLDGRRWTWEGK